MKYDKLVRDKFPQVIANDGKKAVTHIADEGEYGQKLKEKLEEEVWEFNQFGKEEEMADVLEVIDAIIQFRKIDRKGLEETKRKKREERGGFEKRVILEEVI